MPHTTPRTAALLARLKTLHPKLIDLSLDRIVALLAKLGHPEQRLPPVIHVAGTNGKGSTTAFLRAIAEASGLKVHAYTSPHLVRFHERIAVPGVDGLSRPIADDALADLLERVERANGQDPMTFFEITTAAAFLAFAEQPADLVLLEVGLGGEFDATNVIDAPALSVITPIAFDHMDKLGRTLPEIARAKSGIIKHRVTAVVAPQQDEAMTVIDARARMLRAPLISWGRDFSADIQRGHLVLETEGELLELPQPSLLGPHQVINASVAVMAARTLRQKVKFTDAGIAQGLTTAHWPARMQPIKSGELRSLLPAQHELWLDGGHNPAGGQVLSETVRDLAAKVPRPLVMIIGMMGQKDALGFLAPFAGLVERMIVVPVPGTQEPAADPALLAATAHASGFTATTAPGVAEALSTIAASHQNPTRVLICGSLYLAGHVLALNEGRTGVLG